MGATAKHITCDISYLYSGPFTLQFLTLGWEKWWGDMGPLWLLTGASCRMQGQLEAE